MITDKRLKIFSTVARYASFTKAAEKLHLTQPAITFQVKQLEEILGVLLFNRRHSSISLTPAGEEILLDAKKILTLHERMGNRAHEITGQQHQQLVIGATSTIASSVCSELVSAFKITHPDTEIILRVAESAEILNMVHGNDVHVGIVEGNITNQKLQQNYYYSEEMVVVVGKNHQWRSSPAISIQQLETQPLVLRERSSQVRVIIDKEIKRAGLSFSKLNIVMETESLEALKNSISVGLGISIMPRSLIRKELRLGTLHAIPLQKAIELPCYVALPTRSYQLSVVNDLLEHLPNNKLITDHLVAAAA